MRIIRHKSVSLREDTNNTGEGCWVICAVACQGQICVAMVVCWVRDGGKVPLSSRFDRLSDRTKNAFRSFIV